MGRVECCKAGGERRVGAEERGEGREEERRGEAERSRVEWSRVGIPPAGCGF